MTYIYIDLHGFTCSLCMYLKLISNLVFLMNSRVLALRMFRRSQLLKHVCQFECSANGLNLFHLPLSPSSRAAASGGRKPCASSKRAAHTRDSVCITGSSRRPTASY